jgi:glycosyltransferase involved in cell wall biosynthesis
MKKKVLIAVGSASIGGAEKQIATLAKFLNNKYTCRVLFLAKGGPLEKNLSEENVEYEISNLSKHSRPLKVLIVQKLIRRIRKEKYDIVYIFLPQAVLLLGTLLRIFNPATKRIYAVRGSIFIKNNLLYRLYRRELAKGDKIICNSHFLEKELLSLTKMNSGKIHVIHNGLELQPATKQITLSDFTKIIVVANFKAYKGHDLFLRAIKEIKSIKLIVTFVGNGSELEKIKALSSEIEHHEFKFLGEVVDLTEIYQDQDFAVHPSRTEGLSNAILEATANALPVVCFKVGGNEEIISDGKNGFLIEPFDEKQLKNAILKLASDDVLRIKLSQNAISSASRFSWENSSKNHFRIFEMS